MVAYLKAVESWGTCAEILKVRFQDDSGPNSEASWAFFEKRYREAMDRIWAGSFVDEMASDPALPTSYFVEHPDTESDLGDIAEPRFPGDMEL